MELPKESLPEKFSYPKDFLRIIDQGLTNLDPWVIEGGKDIENRYAGLQERYKKRILIPFARRWDNDDVACFDVNYPQKVFIIHDFAKEGFEERKKFDSLWDWFRAAIEDMIEHEP